MNRKADAIIVGAGIIGCAIAFELAKKGYRTLNIDKLASAGAGSTSNSCANVRAYYSTRDGVAMAYESFSYWKNWKSYLETEDERGYAQFKNIGSVLLKNFRKVGVEHEEWDLETLKKMMLMCDFHSFWPPKRPGEDHFWDDGGENWKAPFTRPVRATSAIRSFPPTISNGLRKRGAGSSCSTVRSLKSAMLMSMFRA